MFTISHWVSLACFHVLSSGVKTACCAAMVFISRLRIGWPPSQADVRQRAQASLGHPDPVGEASKICHRVGFVVLLVLLLLHCRLLICGYVSATVYVLLLIWTSDI